MRPCVVCIDTVENREVKLNFSGATTLGGSRCGFGGVGGNDFPHVPNKDRRMDFNSALAPRWAQIWLRRVGIGGLGIMVCLCYPEKR